MSDDGHNARAATGAGARIEHLDEEIRRRENETATWGNPLERSRLEAIRRARQQNARARLRTELARLGTDGSGLT